MEEIEVCEFEMWQSQDIFFETQTCIAAWLTGHLIYSQRWNSYTAFLVEVSGHKLESSQTGVFFWFSTLIFSFYKILFMKTRVSWFSTLIFPFHKMLFMNKFEFSCFADFLLGILKPEKNMVFFKTRQ